MKYLYFFLFSSFLMIVCTGCTVQTTPWDTSIARFHEKSPPVSVMKPEQCDLVNDHTNKTIPCHGDDCNCNPDEPPGGVFPPIADGCLDCLAGGAQDTHLFRAAIDNNQTLGRIGPFNSNSTFDPKERRVIVFNKDSGGPLTTTQSITNDTHPVYFDYGQVWSGHNWLADKAIVSPSGINFILENLAYSIFPCAVANLAIEIRLKRNNLIATLASVGSTNSCTSNDPVLVSIPYLETGPIEVQVGDEVFVTIILNSVGGGGVFYVLAGDRCFQNEAITTEYDCQVAGYDWLNTPTFSNQDTE